MSTEQPPDDLPWWLRVQLDLHGLGPLAPVGAFLYVFQYLAPIIFLGAGLVALWEGKWLEAAASPVLGCGVGALLGGKYDHMVGRRRRSWVDAFVDALRRRS